METIHIHRDDSPDGVRINLRDFDPNLHRIWVAPKIEIPKIETVEIAGLQEPVEPLPTVKKSRKKVKADDLGKI
jgi:hypothetical protein